MDFLPRTLFFYIISHTYLFFHFYKLLRRKRLFLLTLPLFISMGLFPFIYRLLPDPGIQAIFGILGSYWLPFAFFSLVVFVVADFFALMAILLRKRFPGWFLLFFSRKRYLILLFFIAAGIYSYGVYEAHSLRVTELELATDKLPADSGRLRVVFLADLHIGPQTGTDMLASTVSLVQRQKPDLILLGGDLLDDSLQGTPADIKELARLSAPLGVFAVLGNHDAFGGHGKALATIAKTGITLLSNQAVDLGPLKLVGIDDPLVTSQKQGAEPDVIGLLRSGSRKQFTILLDHRPVVRENTLGLFDIQLSGHSHGGQIIMLKKLLESKFGTPTGLSGYHTETGESKVFVTTGTGFSKLPIRLFVPPEIVVIDIAREVQRAADQPGEAP